jgi:hypothetical protein
VGSRRASPPDIEASVGPGTLAPEELESAARIEGCPRRSRMRFFRMRTLSGAAPSLSAPICAGSHPRLLHDARSLSPPDLRRRVPPLRCMSQRSPRS